MIKMSADARLMNYTVKQGTNTLYRLTYLFTTLEGSWEVTPDKPYSIPKWAKDRYLLPPSDPHYFDDAGGNHHLFIRVEDENGNALPVAVRFWSEEDDHGVPLNPITKNTGEKRSGWQNLDIYNSFNPARGERGAWSFAPVDALDILVGGGLPNNAHVSTFAVWSKVDPGTQEPTDPPSDKTIVAVDVTMTTHYADGSTSVRSLTTEPLPETGE